MSGGLVAVSAVVLLLIPPGINVVAYWWHNPLYGYGFWVPLLAVYLIWQRLDDPKEAGREAPSLQCSKEAGRESPDGWSRRTAPAVVLGVYLLSLPALRVLQIANPDWRVADWLLALGAVSAVLALMNRMGGRAMALALGLPVCFLLTAVPWPTAVETLFTRHAVPAVAWASAELLSILGIPAVENGRLILTALGPIEVSDDCGGIRSVHLALMASLFWAGYFHLNGWRPLALTALGLLSAMGINALRVVFLGFLAVRLGRLDAIDRYHDAAGAIALAVLMAALIPLAQAFRPALPPPWPSPQSWRWHPPSAWLPLVLLGWLLATEAGAEFWFRIREFTAPRPAGDAQRWTVNPAPSIAGATAEPMSSAIRENYRYSDSLCLTWEDPHRARWTFIWLDFDQGALSTFIHNIHKPESCLPSAGFSRIRQFPDLKVDLAGKAVPFRHESYQRPDGRFLHLFFAAAQETATSDEAPEADATMQDRLRAALAGRRSQRGSLIHLLVRHTYPAEEARRQAEAYLKQLFAPESNPP